MPEKERSKRNGIDLNSHRKHLLSLSSEDREVVTKHIEAINKDCDNEHKENLENDHATIIDSQQHQKEPITYQKQLSTCEFTLPTFLVENTTEFEQEEKSRRESWNKMVNERAANKSQITTKSSSFNRTITKETSESPIKEKTTRKSAPRLSETLTKSKAQISPSVVKFMETSSKEDKKNTSNVRRTRRGIQHETFNADTFADQSAFQSMSSMNTSNNTHNQPIRRSERLRNRPSNLYKNR